MAILDATGKPIVKPPEPIITDMKLLRKMSKPTTWKDVQELNLVERLKASNATAWTKGVGLAAMQIGVYLRMSWFMDGDKDVILVNPVIQEKSNMVIVPREGCLSIPDIWSQTVRYHKILIMTFTEKGPEPMEFEGFPAIVAQHEIDHMNGVLNLARRYHPPKVIGRNELCPCKSGKKYKKCCIDKLDQPGMEPMKPVGEKDETKRSDDSEKRKRSIREMFGFGKGRG